MACVYFLVTSAENCHSIDDPQFWEMYSQAMDATNYELKTLQNAKYISSKVESSRRRELLSWSHHAEVAKLEPELQNGFLDMAEKEGLSTKELESHAVEIRLRAERRLGQMLKEQKETVGLAKGGQPYQSTSSKKEPVESPTLASIGIDKKLSSRAQKIAAVPCNTIPLHLHHED